MYVCTFRYSCDNSFPVSAGHREYSPFSLKKGHWASFRGFGKTRLKEVGIFGEIGCRGSKYLTAKNYKNSLVEVN